MQIILDRCFCWYHFEPLQDTDTHVIAEKWVIADII